MQMNLLHRRWDRIRGNLMVASILITILAWVLAPTEMPWWWALIPTAVTLGLLWWEGRAMRPEVPLRPLKQLRRNHIGQLVSSDPRPPRTRRLP